MMNQTLKDFDLSMMELNKHMENLRAFAWEESLTCLEFELALDFQAFELSLQEEFTQSHV